jgi:hypothetical protein
MEYIITRNGKPVRGIGGVLKFDGKVLGKKEAKNCLAGYSQGRHSGGDDGIYRLRRK